MSWFAGKIAIVTGGARGIGRAVAHKFAAQGAAVCVVDLPGTELHVTASKIREAGGEAFGYEGDVTRESIVQGYVQAAKQRYGGVDIVFNNAGIMGKFAPLHELSFDEFNKVVQTNLTSVWLGMKHASNAMKQRGGGVIVNNSSVAGLTGLPQLIAYAAAKYAVIGISRTAAVEFAPANIRVNAVCPGLVVTSLSREFIDTVGEEAARAITNMKVPMQRMGNVDEVANLVSFLASDEASYMTGGVYTVDGGYSAQ